MQCSREVNEIVTAARIFRISLEPAERVIHFSLVAAREEFEENIYINTPWTLDGDLLLILDVTTIIVWNWVQDKLVILVCLSRN